MSRNHRSQALWFALVLLLPSRPVGGEITQADRDMVAAVSQRLLAAVSPASVPEELNWPPPVELREHFEGVRHNAYATLKKDAAGNILRDEKTGKRFPLVIICSGMMEKVVAGEEDCLALILAHELAHLLQGHLTRAKPRDPILVKYAFTRAQEDAADRCGAELMLNAGYSLQKGVAGWRRVESLGETYSSFEGLGRRHPAPKDRIALLDKDRALLWRAMSAFRNGTDFLLMEQYAAAAECFAAVTKEFPASHEAWANLGHAQLMQYCDALDAADVRAFGIGQIACRGFYRRPESLEALTRGIHEELWGAAVTALRRALELAPQRAIPKSNLGLAFLVRPAGADVKQARQQFAEAAGWAKSDPQLEEGARVALLVNAGVSFLAGGEADRAVRAFAAAEESLPALQREGLPPGLRASFAQAVLYNRAFTLAKSKDSAERRQAVQKLEEYLRRAGAASVWRTLALERYQELCKELAVQPKGEKELAPRTTAALRKLVSLRLGDGKTLVLGRPIEEVKGQLGDGVESPIALGAHLVRISYARHGIQLIAADRLVAVRLLGAAAPPVILQQTGVTSRGAAIRIGLSRKELDSILADQDYDFQQITDREVDYRFYRDLGLAVRVQEGAVTEIVLAQIPRQQDPHMFPGAIDAP